MDARPGAFTFDLRGRRIRAALDLPAGGAPEWGVVIVPGSGPNDVDGNYPPDPMWPGKPHAYRDLARQLAAAGVAALRYGRGDAVVLDKAEAAAHNDFVERTVVAAEAVDRLAERAGVRRIALAGHSEGSVVGSWLLTLRPDLPVGAFVSLSGPAWRFYDLMIRQIGKRAVDGMLDFGEMKFPVELYVRSVEAARAMGPVPEDLKAALPFGFHAMPEEARRYLRDYDAIDNAETVAGLPLPVLIVQGGADGSVFPDNGERLAEARRGNPAPTATAFFPDLDHFYKKADPAKPFASHDDQDADERVAEAIAEWLGRM